MIRLELPGRPFTVNASHRMHAQVRAKAIREWRSAGYAAAVEAGVPALGPTRVTAWQLVKDRRSLPDVGACYEAVKAAVDGVRDAGAWADDDPAHVPVIELRAPEVAGRDALVVVLEPAAVCATVHG